MTGSVLAEPCTKAFFNVDSSGYDFANDAQLGLEFEGERARFEAERTLKASGEDSYVLKRVERDRLIKLYPALFAEFEMSFEAWLTWVANR